MGAVLTGEPVAGKDASSNASSVSVALAPPSTFVEALTGSLDRFYSFSSIYGLGVGPVLLSRDLFSDL